MPIEWHERNGTEVCSIGPRSNESSTENEMIEEDWFGYITEGLMLTSISTCGFIGNVLSVWVLLRSSLRGNFSYQLTSLAG